MKSIIHKEEFEEIITHFKEVIFFVHSNWSSSSAMSLKILTGIASKRPDLNYVVIKNDNGDSFIYQWLKEQEATFDQNNDGSIKRTPRWIQGNGELFGISGGNLVWFEPSLIGKALIE